MRLTNEEGRQFLNSGKLPDKSKPPKKSKKQKEIDKLAAQLKKEEFMRRCVEKGLPKPTPEFKFHKVRRWRIDFYFESENKKLALEVEGGVFTQGRHTRGKGFYNDMQKYNQFSVYGIYLIRVMPKELLKEETFDLIKSILV